MKRMSLKTFEEKLKTNPNLVLGRQHRVHKFVGDGKILCGVKKWKCSDVDWDAVECKLCLEKRVGEKG